MGPGRQSEGGLRGSVRRAVGDALDATVGKVTTTVGGAALDVTEATAQQVIEELEPYLIEEAVPRIVAGITPFLAQTVIPEVLDGLHEHLVEVTVPDVIDGVTARLVEVTVPEVVAGVTPRLVAELLPSLLTELRPYLEAELVPGIVDGLMPKLGDEVGPELVDALMPKIRDEVAPDLVEALLPRIEQQVAPQLVDALMPKIRDEVAPDLVDALMPKIRTEVVPLILDDIVDDPRIRDLIREQSQGLFLDALESLRENLADADNMAEGMGRRILRRPPRPEPEKVLTIVLDATGGGRGAPMRTSFDELANLREDWQRSPMPPAPPGREFAHAGAVTRILGLAVDLAGVGWLLSQGVAALVNLLDSILDPVPPWLSAGLAAVAASLVPLYLAVCWRLGGRSFGAWLTGTRVCTPDGRSPSLPRALIRAWVGLLGLVFFVVTGVGSLFDPKRRTLLDRMLSTEVRYVVPDDQQHRYIRDAMLQARERERAARAVAAVEDYEAAARDRDTGPGAPGASAA